MAKIGSDPPRRGAAWRTSSSGFGITQHKLAVAIGVPPRRINEIVHGKRRITADTALRLARYFGTTERFWLNLQTRYELEVEKDALGDSLDSIQPLQSARTSLPGGRGGDPDVDRQGDIVEFRFNV